MKRMGWRAISTIAWGVLGALILIGCTRAEPSPLEAAEQIAEPLAAGSLLQVSPPVSSIPATAERQFHATLLGPHRRPRTLGSDATWTVNDPTVATVDPTGLVTANRPGQVTVTATYQGLTATAALTVSSATLVSIQVTPPLRRIFCGGNAVFRATGTFSDGMTFPLGGPVTWTSSDADIAIVDSTGSATGVTGGVAAIVATDTATGESAKAFLTVGSASQAGVCVAPPRDAGQGDASAVDSGDATLGAPDGADASEEDGGLVPTCSQCSGECVDLTSDVANCGGCGNACAPGDECTNGTCQCLGTLCNGQCVDTANDLFNCGACGNPCTAIGGQVCSDGVCQCAFPVVGPVICNGNCVNVLIDDNNCGACGRVCRRVLEACTGGSCRRL